MLVQPSRQTVIELANKYKMVTLDNHQLFDFCGPRDPYADKLGILEKGAHGWFYRGGPPQGTPDHKPTPPAGG